MKPGDEAEEGERGKRRVDVGLREEEGGRRREEAKVGDKGLGDGHGMRDGGGVGVTGCLRWVAGLLAERGLKL